MSYLNEHWLHLLLLSISLGLGVVIWFWDKINQKRNFFDSLVVFAIILLVVLHVSPLSLIIAEHHQSEDHGAFHICCITPSSDQVASVAVDQSVRVFREDLSVNFLIQKLSPVYSTNSRSPPIS